MFKTDLRYVFDFIRYSEDKDKWYDLENQITNGTIRKSKSSLAQESLNQS